ncbi:unnamed protein product [Psylliodes chrysocephalus]|uniref:Uncharacterized protein n=1 Tax=Psylliodes chrysocephalus TaxID=3402493 RepID=A0A9P0CXZ9_9CUCU|nr:unnamed protein product [Psylliodes chrysocephala]
MKRKAHSFADITEASTSQNKKSNVCIPHVFPQGLEAILSKYTDGQIVLLQKNKLNNCLRQKLVKVVITELFPVYGLEIRAEVFTKLAKEIEELFPNENAATYYLPYTTCKDKDKGRKSIGPRGKLYTKYVNCKTQLRLANAQKNTQKAPNKKVESPKSVSAKTSLEFLKVAIEPYPKILEAWEDSLSLRKKVYCNVSLDVIYKDLPCLKQNFGIELIETDFNRKYPDSTDIIYTTWPKVAKAILKEAQERKIKLPESTDDNTQAILILPYLFQPTTIKKSRKGCNWRPSRSEIQESFFIHVANVSEIDEKAATRRAKLAEYGLTLQPYACVIGDLDNLTFAVVIEDNKYFLQSCVRTIELLFKCFYALDVEFPIESDQIWQFISEEIFKIKLQFRSPTVDSMISDLAFHLGNELD